MPAALMVDWRIAESLYMQGVSVREVAHRLGVKHATVESRAKRYQWPERRKRTLAMVAVAAVERVEKGLAERGKAVLGVLMEDVEETVKNLPKPRKQAPLRDLLVRETVMEKLTNRAMKTAGLDQPGSMTLVNIERLSLQESTDQASTTASVIDVESSDTPSQ